MFRALFCSSSGGTVCTADIIRTDIPIAAHTVPPDEQKVLETCRGY
jgi:hypothetical protein